MTQPVYPFPPQPVQQPAQPTQGYTPPTMQAQQPPIQYGPPPAVPAGSPPMQAPPVQGYAPPPIPSNVNPYAGIDQTAVTQRTPNIPPGQHLLEFVKYERANTGSGEFTFITFKVLESSVPNLAGSEVAIKQNMKPAHRGGIQIAFGAIKSVMLPVFGLTLDDPRVKDIESQGLLATWLYELELKGTVQGQPLTGRKVLCIATPGTRKANTPADKEPFPKYNFSPR